VCFFNFNEAKQAQKAVAALEAELNQRSQDKESALAKAKDLQKKLDEHTASPDFITLIGLVSYHDKNAE